MEEHLFGRAGLPFWATKVAEGWLKRPRIDTSALCQALNIEPRPPEPNPISSETDVDAFAADVVKKFKVREDYTAWLQQRHAESSKRLLERLKAIEAEGTP